MSNSELTALESRVSKIELQIAVREERDKKYDDDIAEIKAFIKESRNDNKWIFRLVVGLIVSLFSTILVFYIKGGLGSVG